MNGKQLTCLIILVLARVQRPCALNVSPTCSVAAHVNDVNSLLEGAAHRKSVDPVPNPLERVGHCAETCSHQETGLISGATGVPPALFVYL